jgi:hypothetical protein
VVYASYTRARQDKFRALLDEFNSWLNKSANQVRQTALGQAVTYTLGQWNKLERYLENSQLQIDNNRVERTVKLLVIGQEIGCSRTALRAPEPVRCSTVSLRRPKPTG